MDVSREWQHGSEPVSGMEFLAPQSQGGLDMFRRLLLCVAIGLSTPAFAGPFDPGQHDNWISLGAFHGPWGGARAYTDLSDKTGQPAAVPKGQYLVHFWLVLDSPHDTPKGTVAQIDIFTRIDCPTQSAAHDENSASYYGTDGQKLWEDSGSQEYSLSKAETNTGDAKLLEAYCR